MFALLPVSLQVACCFCVSCPVHLVSVFCFCLCWLAITVYWQGGGDGCRSLTIFKHRGIGLHLLWKFPPCLKLASSLPPLLTLRIFRKN